GWWARFALPTLVLARRIRMATFRDGMAQPGWPPELGRRSIGSMPTEALRAAFCSKIAIGSSSGPGWLNELQVRIRQGRVEEDGQAYHDLCRDRYRQTQARRGTRWQSRADAGREHAGRLYGAGGVVAAPEGQAGWDRGERRL